MKAYKASRRTYLLESLLASFNLFSMVKFPTRIFKNSSTIIDNIFVNIHKFDFSVYPFINGLSNHDAQIIAFTDIFISTTKQTFSSIRKIDSNTINTFVLQLSYENWENVFLEENVNVIFNNFLNTDLKIFYASFPFVKLKKSCKPRPWITKGVKFSCVKKRKLYLTYRNSNNPKHKEHYKEYCRYGKCFQCLFYSSSPKSSCKKFSKRGSTNNNNPMIYLRQNLSLSSSTMKLKNTTTHEINKIIHSLKSKNSHCYVEISSNILKASAPSVLSPLTYIFNEVLSSGIFPDRFKFSEVKLLFNKGEKMKSQIIDLSHIYPSFLKS